MCLRILKPIVKTRWTVILNSDDSKSSLISQGPVFTSNDPHIEGIVRSADADEPLGMPDDMEIPDRTPTKGQQMLTHLVEEYVNRVNTGHPYRSSLPLVKLLYLLTAASSINAITCNYDSNT